MLQRSYVKSSSHDSCTVTVAATYAARVILVILAYATITATVT